MEEAILNSLSTHLNAAYACVSAERRVLQHNRLFDRLAEQKSSNFIEDLIPELVGLEDILTEIAAGGRNAYVLKYIQRQKADKTLFYNFHLVQGASPSCAIIFWAEDVTEQALERQELIQKKNEILLLQQLAASRSSIFSSSILGNSEPIRRLREMVQKISRIPSTTVLLQGESGTGKNLVAKVLHYNSDQAHYPFVEINCAAIPESLLEAELFGYEKGAFTNAVTARAGLLEEAHQGTLFLDEIGELPLKLQAKLLSVLESKTFRRLGSNKPKEVDFRLIAATNRNLPELVRKGEFREDLFYRLNVVTLHLPPLREMGRDVLIIADHFRQVFNLEFKKNIQGFNEAAQKALLRYHWPGNVRELSNCVERAMIFADGPLIKPDELLLQGVSKEETAFPLNFPETGLNLQELEIRLINAALEKAKGNKTEAARLLGLTRDTLRYRMEKYGLKF